MAQSKAINIIKFVGGTLLGTFHVDPSISTVPLIPFILLLKTIHSCCSITPSLYYYVLMCISAIVALYDCRC